MKIHSFFHAVATAILASLFSVATLVAMGKGSTGDGTMTLRLGVVTPSDHPHSLSVREFARLVEEKSNGKLKIQVADNGSLGSNPELLDAVKTGSIDFAVSTPGVMAEYSVVTGILELPYVFASKKHMMNVTRGPVGKQIASDYESDTGIKIIGYFGGAQRNMITKGAEIASMADLQGKKMRTWEWDVMLNWWKSLGAIGSVISFPEVYTALQTGVVDGAENEFSTFTTARWAEVAKHISLTQHSITVRPLVMNVKKLHSLPAELQSILLEAAQMAADFDVKLEAELDQKNMEKLQAEYKVQFTKPDKASFIQASEQIILTFAQEKGLESLAQDIQDAR